MFVQETQWSLLQTQPQKWIELATQMDIFIPLVYDDDFETKFSKFLDGKVACRTSIASHCSLASSIHPLQSTDSHSHVLHDGETLDFPAPMLTPWC